VYKGAKYFKNYQKKIEIIIVNHEEVFSCIELIVLGVRNGNKAKRLYLDAEVLLMKVDITQFNKTFEIKQNASIRQSKYFDEDLQMKLVAWNMITAMIMNQLQISPSSISGVFELYFEPTSTDVGTIFTDFQNKTTIRLNFELVAKPENLLPYKLTDRYYCNI
jgi:hypothetical protein